MLVVLYSTHLRLYLLSLAWPALAVSYASFVYIFHTIYSTSIFLLLAEHKRSGSELGAIHEGDENVNEGEEDEDFYDDTQWLPSPKASFR